MWKMSTQHGGGEKKRFPNCPGFREKTKQKPWRAYRPRAHVKRRRFRGEWSKRREIRVFRQGKKGRVCQSSIRRGKWGDAKKKMDSLREPRIKQLGESKETRGKKRRLDQRRVK